MLAMIKRCGSLDGQSLNLFGALERPPRSDLFDLYLRENLYQPGSHYVYVTPDSNECKYTAFRPIMTERVMQLGTVAPCGLFSNTLLWGETPPSERAHNAGFGVYTIEFDHMPLTDQFQIIWSGKVKRIDAELRRYRDYRGYEAVYSGSKSIHFHFVFDIRHLKHELIVTGNSSYRDYWTQDLPDLLLRPSYEICWYRLATIFRGIAEISDQADVNLSRWEQLRRCPWALRQTEAGHPLGLPADRRVAQVVLAQNVFRNVKRGATEWFHEPCSLLEQCCTEKARRRSKRLIEQDIAPTSREVELFEQHAPQMFSEIIGADYPKFAWSKLTQTGFKSFFYNNAADRRPSSFCEGNRDRILLCGEHGFDASGLSIGATPNQIFDWIESSNREDGDPEPDDWVIRRYKAAVHDHDSLACFLDETLIEMVAPQSIKLDLAWINRLLATREASNSHVLICAPQGCGKSTTIMTQIPTIHARDPGQIFFSSPSITQAQEKAETFARVNRDERFVAFLYLSLTALYESFCPEADRITHADILDEGGSSWLHAIYDRQRHIYDQMFAHRLGAIGLHEAGKIPVLFGTHETMRQHVQEGMTRAFYASDFGDWWFDQLAKEERLKARRDLIGQNDFHRVIVDEVTAHDLVSIHTYEVVAWARECVQNIDLDHIDDIAERHQRFAIYLSEHPCAGMTWNVFLDVLNCEYSDEHVVEVSGREIPYDDRDGIYGQMVGRRYFVRSRGWWNSFWRVSMLTTEAVPTRIVESIDREASTGGEQQDDRFKVYEFALPRSAHDFVRVQLHKACKKESLDALVRAYHAAYPTAIVVSDMLKGRISEFTVATHMAAKGSNAYIDSDLIAFYNAPSPALFAELGALNTRFGRSDLVRLFYRDRYEQTCGRNRGFRGQNGREHIAVFPPRLNKWLAAALSSASYVGVHARSCVDPHVGSGHVQYG